MVVLGAVVAAGALAWGLRPRGSTPVTEDDALEDFRGRTSTTVRAPGDAGGGPALPEAGVYRYDMVGTESVKLGPLPTEDRTYPDLVTAVVTHPSATCFEFTVNLIEQHTEVTRYCREAAGLRLTEHHKHQQVGAVSPTATMRCDPDVLVTASATAPTELRCSLTLTGGPAKVTAKVEGTATPGATERQTVGDQQVEVRLVSIDSVISGSLSGTWSEKLWLDVRTDLPVRIERAFDLTGLATFRERSRLELADLTPAR